MLDPARFEELKNTGNLPSPRGVALEIIRLTQSDHVSNQQLARALQSDPALTGKLLKAANSPLLGMSRPIMAVPDAVMLLGLSMVRQLALGFSLVSDNRHGACQEFDYPAYWQDALLTAVAAHAVAQQMNVANAEETFVLGLLAQIGKLALATLYPDRYGRVLRGSDSAQPQLLLQAELAAFQTTHTEIGSALLQDWGFPRLLWSAVAAHEDPEQAELMPHSREYRIAVVLNLASEIARLMRASADHPPEQLRQQSQALLFHAARVGMDAVHLSALLDDVVERWKAWSGVFQIQTYEFDLPLPTDNAPCPEPGAALATEKVRQPIRSLIVDDDPAAILVLRRLLEANSHTVEVARHGREALEMSLKFCPDLVVTDWMMPQMDGLQLTRALRETKAGQGMYILFLTSVESEEKLLEAFDTGIDDYVLKPIQTRFLTARIRAAERFVRQRQALAQDMEEIRRMAHELAINNRRLQQAVLTDPLTGLPNRRYALDRLEQEISLARRRNGVLSIIMLDVDFFKRVNDQFGHDVGDAVLRHVAGILRAKARLQDSICRVGGEEFLMICPDTQKADAIRCGERLRSALEAAPYQSEQHRIVVTASFGTVTSAPEILGTDLIKSADQAVYRAKQEGRNRVVAA